jgi:hypothetical protein
MEEMATSKSLASKPNTLTKYQIQIFVSNLLEQKNSRRKENSGTTPHESWL